VATITSLLRDHVALQVRSVDRLFLQGYVPKLMSAGLVCRFLLDRGYNIPSPALLGNIGKGFVAAIERYAAQREILARRHARADRAGSVCESFAIPKRPQERRAQWTESSTSG
jgi:hypothetical protein